MNAYRLLLFLKMLYFQNGPKMLSYVNYSGKIRLVSKTQFLCAPDWNLADYISQSP